jgi:hypothetical protein
MKKEQEKNMARRNKEEKNGMEFEKEGRQFEEGDKVLIRRHPTTNKEKFEHKKLKLPWEGPYVVGEHDKEKYPNTYKIIKEDKSEEVINEKNIKRFYERPAWMKTNEPEDWLMDVESEESSEESEYEPEIKNRQAKESNPKDKKQGEQKPKEIAREELQETKEKPKGAREEQSKLPEMMRRSKRVETQWKPKVGDEIDIRFYYMSKKRWSCGTIKQVDRNAGRIFVEFLDGKNEDWYELAEEEIRQCTEKHGHVRSKEPTIAMIKAEAMMERQRAERRTTKTKSRKKDERKEKKD